MQVAWLRRVEFDAKPKCVRRSDCNITHVHQHLSHMSRMLSYTLTITNFNISYHISKALSTLFNKKWLRPTSSNCYHIVSFHVIFYVYM